jgi:hypothetical protein
MIFLPKSRFNVMSVSFKDCLDFGGRCALNKFIDIVVLVKTRNDPIRSETHCSGASSGVLRAESYPHPQALDTGRGVGNDRSQRIT